MFGARAGRAAARYAAGAPDPGTFVAAQARDEERRLTSGLRDRADGRESIADLRTGMQQTMEDSAGIFRTEGSLVKGAATLRDLQERSESMAIDDHSRAFNTQVVAALELSNMLDVAEAIIAAALRREESRGPTSASTSRTVTTSTTSRTRSSISARRAHTGSSTCP